MTGQQRVLLITALLFMAVLSSAIMTVYSKHQSRKLFVELQELKHQVDALNTEWGQLQLEQSAWSGHGRIEQVARERLSMVMPSAEEVVFIKP
ncbi:MAG: cell division protein FtsL [Gammaproteobacteria bacterium]|nr:cell division protein FtsL [Gammaproteobacteria bacterium]MCW8922623.1 cell division protein FtsL [Gammaproteobacteria bacterium]